MQDIQEVKSPGRPIRAALLNHDATIAPARNLAQQDRRGLLPCNEAIERPVCHVHVLQAVPGSCLEPGQ